ncbi:MAG TPA: AMP-dependent synthetase/ligase [Sporichthya sp.]|nr:AMP-dependent synthetase/ligase [Sporichthya sp.]
MEVSLSRIHTSERPIQTGVPALEAGTICEAFQLTAAAHADRVALRTPDDSVSLTFAEYNDRVRRLAGGLAALGVGPGDTVALMMLNRPEFNLVDMAALHLGAVPFSVYNSSSPEQVEYVFSNAQNTVAICESRFLETVRKAGPALAHIVCIDGGDGGTLSLDELMARGEEGFDFEAAWRAVQPDDVLTLIYTSGTTGPPKGVQLTHAGMLAENRGCSAFLPGHADPSIVSYLPSAHIADRWSQHYYASVTFGATVTCIPDMAQLIPGLISSRPTMWGGVPRVWEKIMAALQAQGLADPAALPEEVRAGARAKIGLDRVQWSICGAAPIAPEVLEYFLALGLPIQELWGMSETSCCLTINPIDDIRVGSVGQILPGMEFSIAEDGEALVRGPLVMSGYRNDPERTAEAIDADGWMHTGDVCVIDDDGYITIVDRKKELIINAGGKNMSPANIEQKLKASHALIGQAVCIGDGRRYNTALLVLDPDAAAAYAKQAGLPDSSPAAVAADPAVQQIVANAVEAANERLSRVEQIKKFHLLDVDWLPGGDELTPTMKLKRKPISEKYAAYIEALYRD